eukprot:scaffold1398_cov259-Pinguiococcus_pyrenoidosus.AAC.2
MPRFAGVEGGGTTFRAAIAVDDPQNIEIMESFPTTTPEETLQSVADWLRQQGAFDAMGKREFCAAEDREINDICKRDPACW